MLLTLVRKTSNINKRGWIIPDAGVDVNTNYPAGGACTKKALRLVYYFYSPDFYNQGIKMNEAAKHIVFSGSVQGIGFRFTALSIASRYQLKGYVRNLPDGSVEMLAQGPAQIIDNCVRDIQDSFMGYVRKTDVDVVPLDSKLTDFKITF